MNPLATDEIFTILKNTSEVTDLLDNINDAVPEKAIFNEAVLPKTVNNEPLKANKTILIKGGGYPGGECYNVTTVTIDCRGGTPGQSGGGQSDAISIQAAVAKALDRISKYQYHFVADALAPIPPIDDTDNYNAPVSVRCKLRKAIL